MGYRDVRANESRVHTRITDSGSGREQQCGTITIWRTELVTMGTEVGFQSQMRIQERMPRTSGRDS